MVSKLRDVYNSSAKLSTYSFLLPACFFLIYIFFPIEVSTTDGYSYAHQILTRDLLFDPHHLLYNYTGLQVYQLVSFFTRVEILPLLKLLNALIAALILYILDRILKLRGADDKSRLLWILITGSSWGIMRFATENEAYIFPLFFSIIGSFWLAKFYRLNNSTPLLLAGLFTALAALFHQIHFFWWLGFLLSLLIYNRRIKHVFIFALPVLFVPAIYFLIFKYGKASPADHFFEFIFSNYYSGDAEFSIDQRNFFLTPISFIRTFLQVHGYIYNLIVENLLYLLVLVICSGCFIASLIKRAEIEGKAIWKQPFLVAHACVFILHLLFAFLSHGNAEFMAMLPVVLVIILSATVKIAKPAMLYLGIGLFTWNLFFGLIPLSTYDVNGDSMAAEFILERDSLNSDYVFILFNRPRVNNIIEYKSKDTSKARLEYIAHFENKAALNSFIRDNLRKGKAVFTDCVERPKTLSRASFLTDNQSDAYTDFQKQHVDSTHTLGGQFFLTQLQLVSGK